MKKDLQENSLEENEELEKEINKSSAEKPEQSSEESTGDILKENPDEELSKAEMNVLIEEFTTKQNQRFLQFLRDSTSNPELSNNFLMKSLESQVDDAPISKQKNNDEENKLEYMKYESPEDSEYQNYSPLEVQRADDPNFENKSSSERILEEQKRFTKSAFGGGYKDDKNSSEPEYIRMEDIDPDKIPRYKST